MAEPLIHEMDLTDEATKTMYGVRSGGGNEYVLVFGPEDAQIVVGTNCGVYIERDICGVHRKPPW